MLICMLFRSYLSIIGGCRFRYLFGFNRPNVVDAFSDFSVSERDERLFTMPR